MKPGKVTVPFCFSFLGVVVFTLLIAGPVQAGPCLTTASTHPLVKWSQCPDFEFGYDILSNDHTVMLVADDFRSDGRPVTDVHWWGSYERNQIITPLMFWIGFWSDKAGADPSQPDTLLKSYKIPFPETHEDFTDFQTRRQPPSPTDMDIMGFQYFVDLPEPFFEERGVTYWLSIQALSSPTWGWKTSFDDPHFRDDAVKAFTLVPMDVGTMWPGPDSFEKQVDPITLHSKDMAFELTTIPEPSTILLLGSGLAGLAYWRRRKA
jgi:hypothetical protein